MQDFISTETSSQTAMACEQAALFGATPGRDEFDNREIWNEDEALAGIEEAIHPLHHMVRSFMKFWCSMLRLLSSCSRYVNPVGTSRNQQICNHVHENKQSSDVHCR